MFGVVIIFIQCVVYTNYSSQAKQDDWLVTLASAILGIPLVFMYLRIYKLNPEKNLFEIFDALLGNAGGKIATFVFALYATCLCALSIRNFTDYVQIMVLPNTPILYVTVFYAIMCLYFQRKGMVTLGRYSLYILPYAIFIALITLLASSDVMNIKRLLPVAGQPFGTMWESVSVMSLFAFGQVFVLLGLLPTRAGKSNQGKAVWLAYGFATLYAVVTLMRAIAILGAEAYGGFFYPIYASYSVLRIGDFGTHLEPLISGCIVAMILVRTTVYASFLNMGVARLAGTRDDMVFSLPVMAICAAVSLVLYHHAGDKGPLDLLFRFFSAFALIVVPFVLWLISQARQKKKAAPDAK